MITDEQVVKDHLDLEMLERPHLWPSGGLLGNPIVWVKRGYNGRDWRETGPCTVLNGVYRIVAHDWEKPGEKQTLNYASAEAVYNDGWRVD